MPYPPPPGPPTLGIFQAIGKVQEIPDPTAQAGKFLGTDGVLTLWDPVSGGVLPDMTGHAGQFLTNDGVVTASWAAVLPSEAGHAGQFLTTDGVSASWSDVPGTFSAEDIRTYGAVPNDPTFDNIGAIEAAIAAVNSAFIPPGNWYFGRPIMVGLALSSPLATGQGTRIHGAGRGISTLIVGVGLPSTPSLVQGFGGPSVYIIRPLVPGIPGNRQYPTYGTSLVSGPGQSMDLDPSPAYVKLLLSDSFPWGVWLPYFADQLSCRGWVKWTDAYSAGPKCIWASMGPQVNQGVDVGSTFNLSQFDLSIGLFMFGSGGNQFLRAYLTTYDNGQLFIDSGVLANNTTYHWEIDYTGAHFYFYVNGVLQGSVAATGIIKKHPWEAVVIGQVGDEVHGSVITPVTGSIDSFELASAPYHTGSNFTPPTSKHTWGVNTLWLCNFDQGQAPFGDQPYVIAQTTCTSGAISYLGKQYSGTAQPPAYGGPLPHYMRGAPTGDIGNVSPDTYVEDLSVQCNLGTTGIITWGGWRATIRRTIVTGWVTYAIKAYDPLAFFCNVEENYILSGAGVGIQYQGSFCLVNKTLGCPIGVWCNGVLNGHQDQPSWNSFLPLVIGDNLAGNFQNSVVANSSVDEEGSFNYIPQRAPVFVMGSGEGPLTWYNNLWIGGSTIARSTPTIIYWSVPSAGAIHIGDSFWKTDDNTTVFLSREPVNDAYATPAVPITDGYIKLIGCNFNGRGFDDPLCIGPLSNRDDWISVETPFAISAQTGLSTTNTATRNLTGSVYVLHGFTTGTVLFPTPEANANYNLAFAVRGFSGSAPAAGSTTVVGYVTSETGFTVTVGADPAGTCQLELTWTLLGAPQPFDFEYVPAIPSTVNPNPLVVDAPTGDFAVGVTLVPAVGNALPYNTAIETITEAGTAPTNFWQLNFTNAQILATLGSSTATQDSSFVINGTLYSLLSPGTHNVALAYRNGIGWAYVDGGPIAFYGPGSLVRPAPGTQQSPIHIGETASATQPLISATLRNFKLAQYVNQVLTAEPTTGPVGQPQSAFLGDDFIVGYGSTAGSGGAATQIASARYGTKYYNIAARNGGVAAANLGSISVPDNYWSPWGSLLPLENICVCLGFNDVSQGVTAVDAMAGIQNVFEGGQAEGFWGPTAQPDLSSAASIFSQSEVAFTQIRGPLTSGGGTPTITIHGIAIPWPYGATQQAGALAFAATVNANGTLSPLITARPVLTQDLPGGFYYVIITANAIGTAGNGITVVSDGVNGSLTYPTPYTQGAFDLYIHIDGNPVLANWAGSTAATRAAVTAACNGDPGVSALGTATDTGTAQGVKFVMTARGAAGNAIAVDSQPQGPGVGWTDFQNTPITHLTRGYNGALSSVSNVLVLCNVPPFGQSSRYTAPFETQRLALNTAIGTYVGAHPAITLADMDVTLRDPGNHTNLNPAYVFSDNLHLNDAGYTAMFGLINPLLP